MISSVVLALAVAASTPAYRTRLPEDEVIYFVLPDRFDIYLHDTPAGHLFSRQDRSFSHGCIRVADAMGLAHEVLRGRRESDFGELQRLIDSGKTTTLASKRPLTSALKKLKTHATNATETFVLKTHAAKGRPDGPRPRLPFPYLNFEL